MKFPGLNYSSPYEFTPKQRLQLALIPPAAAAALWVVMRWCRRFEVRHPEYLEDTLQHGGHAVLAFWHETMHFAMWRHRWRNFHTTTSYSYDGELAARVIPWFGCEAVRGSSSKGGSEALEHMEKAIGAVPTIGITLDGPRGPRRTSKPGAAILAARTQTPIVPVAFALRPSWRLRSWDRFAIPKPLGKIICAYGVPIPPPPDTTPESIESCRQAIESALNALHNDLEAEIGDTAALD